MPGNMSRNLYLQYLEVIDITKVSGSSLYVIVMGATKPASQMATLTYVQSVQEYDWSHVLR